MKNIIILFVLILFFSCKKGSNIPNTTSETYPQEWILMIDESADRYTHIEIAGNNTKRSKIDKTYSLVSLADERECKFKISQSRNEANNKDCYEIQSVQNKNRWLYIGYSPNKQEIHLYSGTTGSEFNAPDDDSYKFLVHKIGKTNGVKTVALESVALPGYYISSSQPGFNYSPTQVVLLQASSPEKATAWQCH